MTMTEDQVMWGAAVMLIKQHGDLAPVKVAERIGQVAMQGDDEGVVVWRAVAAHMDAILRAGSVQ